MGSCLDLHISLITPSKNAQNVAVVLNNQILFSAYIETLSDQAVSSCTHRFDHFSTWKPFWCLYRDLATAALFCTYHNALISNPEYNSLTCHQFLVRLKLINVTLLLVPFYSFLHYFFKLWCFPSSRARLDMPPFKTSLHWCSGSLLFWNTDWKSILCNLVLMEACTLYINVFLYQHRLTFQAVH